jgi:Ca-activated chloride channel family protein
MSNHNGDGESRNIEPEQLTAYALGQLKGEELKAFKSALSAEGTELAHKEVREIQAAAAALSAARNAEPSPPASDALREQLVKRVSENQPGELATGKAALRVTSRRSFGFTARQWLVIAAAACLMAAISIPAFRSSRERAFQAKNGNVLKQIAGAFERVDSVRAEVRSRGQMADAVEATKRAEAVTSYLQGEDGDRGYYERLMSRNDKFTGGDVAQRGARSESELTTMVGPRIIIQEEEEQRLGIQLPGEVKHAGVGNEWEWRTHPGQATMQGRSILTRGDFRQHERSPGTEQYDRIFENPFLSPLSQPLSTFSIDVDTASYSNVRRFLNGGRLPPPDAVRIEELVNYFRYDYPQPPGNDPFSVTMDVTQCSWREGHLLLRVGLKGRDVQRGQRPQSNLVFLLDVSGSMADANKLPLLKTAMKMLVEELGENDRVSIVTYAGDAGLRLPPTRGHEQAKIKGVIDSLSSGGSTNGSAGIELAYEQAAAYFVSGGTNRVILCTDGDLNVGITDDDALVKLIKRKASSGTFLTVLGFGEGNLKDAKMEKLADNGNGLYAYIDSVREARKVLVEQLTGSTITIAKDVKIQIEFNPREIAAYRLLGYENRVMAAQDFNNDRKDAGEIGAGHTVTALYELVPAGAVGQAATPRPGTDPLRYQQPGANLHPENERSRLDGGRPGPDLVPAGENALTEAASTGELLTLKLRYKEPDGQTSKLLEYPLKDRGGQFNTASRDLQFAAAVASFGMILRGSEHRGAANLAAVAEIASATLGNDPGGYRAEFVDLVRKAQGLGAR